MTRPTGRMVLPPTRNPRIACDANAPEAPTLVATLGAIDAAGITMVTVAGAIATPQPFIWNLPDLELPIMPTLL